MICQQLHVHACTTSVRVCMYSVLMCTEIHKIMYVHVCMRMLLLQLETYFMQGVSVIIGVRTCTCTRLHVRQSANLQIVSIHVLEEKLTQSSKLLMFIVSME